MVGARVTMAGGGALNLGEILARAHLPTGQGLAGRTIRGKGCLYRHMRVRDAAVSGRDMGHTRERCLASTEWPIARSVVQTCGPVGGFVGFCRFQAPIGCKFEPIWAKIHLYDFFSSLHSIVLVQCPKSFMLVIRRNLVPKVGLS